MSELPISSPYRSTPEAPVTEDERNQLSTRLNAAYESGAIDADDYRARLDGLFAAQRMGDLVRVVDRLPPLQTYATPAIVGTGAGPPGQLSPTRGGGTLTAVTVGTIAGALLLVIVLLAVLLL